MMKQKWVRPQAVVQTFVANEYIAAQCGDKEQMYYFTCNADPSIWAYSYSVYTNGADGVKGTSDDVRLGSFHACGQTHQASTSDDFINGYIERDYGHLRSYDVIIWRGENGDNIHCTTNLNMEQWEVNKS